MEWIKCDENRLDELADLYDRVVDDLEAHINYPKWSHAYPCRESVQEAILQGCQYAACLEDGRIAGATVINDNPGGDYEAGEWSRPLKRGEYLIIHSLAVDPGKTRCGIGDFMVKQGLALAKEEGFRAVRLDVVPGNTPARKLYERNGFTYAGTKDLKRGFANIPVFELYEKNL